MSPPSKTWGMELAQKAVEAGLVITNAATGATTPIPLSLNPMVLSKAGLVRCQQLASHLAQAGVKMAYALHNGCLRDCIWQALSPLEKSLMRPSPPVLATARLDCFPSEGKLWALELNATIPAMQAYSDMAAAQTIAAHGQRLRLDAAAIARLQEANPSNTRALWEALLWAYAACRPGQQPRRLGILCRRNDAQLSELLHLRRAFGGFGLPTELLHPDQLEEKDGFWANGQCHDLVYRHLFVHRLEENLPGHALLRRLLAKGNTPDTPSLVFNPPAAPVEMKATFALLSEAVENEALAVQARLSPEECEAIAQWVPWTRLCEGKALLKAVQREPERYVLKKSWSYGGKAVFIGKTHQGPEFAQRCQEVFGEPLSWEALCERAFEAREGGYVVQQRVENVPQAHVLCTPSQVTACQLYVDFSVYASVGIHPLPLWGGVCRGSSSQVVNILGGGGLVPLLCEEVAEALQLGESAYCLDECTVPA